MNNDLYGKNREAFGNDPQTVIDRMGRNSFQLKGWSMTLIVASTVLIARTNLPSPLFSLALILPIIVFWGLDGYFLWQEKLFRGIYDDVRKQVDTDFEMNLKTQKNKPNHRWRDAYLGQIALYIFYIGEIIFILFVFGISLYLLRVILEKIYKALGS